MKMALGHNRRARVDGMAEWMPKARASYEHDATTPRSPAPPTITGCPVSDGSWSTSTATKKASMSTCNTVLTELSGLPDNGDAVHLVAVQSVAVGPGVEPALGQPGAQRLPHPRVAVLQVHAALVDRHEPGV